MTIHLAIPVSPTLLTAFILLSSCAGPHNTRRAGRPQARAPVRVFVRFDPPLARPGVLLVNHVSGFKTEVDTTTNGVELRMPPGRAVFRLVIGKDVWERSVSVHEDEVIVFARGIRAR